MQDGGLPSRGIAGSNANFLPRFGFAYTPSFGWGGTVIRGGYGEYIYPVPVRNSIRYLTASYPFTAGYSQSYTSAAQSPDGLPNSLLRSPLTVITGVNSANVVDTNSTTALLPGIGAGHGGQRRLPAGQSAGKRTSRSSSRSRMVRCSARLTCSRTARTSTRITRSTTPPPLTCGR